MRRAYTIIEVLIAALLLSLAIIPLYNMFTASSKTVFRSRLSYLAVHVAREMLEELRQIPFAKLDTVAHGNSWRRVSEEGKGVFRFTNETRNAAVADKLAGEAFEYPEDYKRIKTMLNISPADATTLAEANVAKVELTVIWEETGENEERDAASQQKQGVTKFVTILTRFGPGTEERLWEETP